MFSFSHIFQFRMKNRLCGCRVHFSSVRDRRLPPTKQSQAKRQTDNYEMLTFYVSMFETYKYGFN